MGDSRVLRFVAVPVAELHAGKQKKEGQRTEDET